MCTRLDCFRDGISRKLNHDTMSHDDIRRSLEVLDSVLAEFDDCLESWDSIVPDKSPVYVADKSLRLIRSQDESGIVANDDTSSNSFSYDSQTTDGSTSHDSGLSLQEQIKVTSPPPVPKRNASTKLSDRGSGLFTFPLADSQSFDSLPSDFATHDNGKSLSKNEAISTLSAKDDDEVFKRNDNNAEVHCCTKCGTQIDVKRNAMEKNIIKDASSSPFLEKRKLFEDKIGESSTINVSPMLERAFTGSSFKVRTNRTKESESEPSSLIIYKTIENDRSDSSQSSFASKFSPKATKVAPPRVDALLSLPNSIHHAPNCNCKERIRQLQVKFAETRRLLKTNKIRGLDAKPPSFVPPPPPPDVVAKNAVNEIHSTRKLLSNGFSDSATASNSNSFSASNGSLNSESVNSDTSYNSHPSPVPDIDKNSKTNSEEQKLCNRCSISESLPISETFEDVPKLLPIDALKRPHLGLSLCMEDDFCPGVKEILQTSISRNGLPLSKNKLNSLSTFSLSDSSLGYVSSQSDLELSNSPYKAEKVPVSNVKFSTLPEGMDLHSLPSYYGHEETAENERKSSQPLYRDRNFNHTTELQLRSSSAPPEPENEKPKKKHFRGFSRKDKKDKKKNEDSISVTSYLSLDDGMILKTIDGDTSSRSGFEIKETGVEKKRWSGLRSLLGKR